MAQALRKQTILPVVTSRSDAFIKGYLSAQDGHATGWPIKYAPRGDTIVEFLLQAHALLEDDDINRDWLVKTWHISNARLEVQANTA